MVKTVSNLYRFILLHLTSTLFYGPTLSHVREKHHINLLTRIPISRMLKRPVLSHESFLFIIIHEENWLQILETEKQIKQKQIFQTTSLLIPLSDIKWLHFVLCCDHILVPWCYIFTSVHYMGHVVAFLCIDIFLALLFSRPYCLFMWV